MFKLVETDFPNRKAVLSDGVNRFSVNWFDGPRKTVIITDEKSGLEVRQLDRFHNRVDFNLVAAMLDYGEQRYREGVRSLENLRKYPD